MRAMVPLLLLLGCGELGHNDYVDARAGAECRKLSKCHRGLFESEFRDLDDCEGDLAVVEVTLFNDCDYDAREAAACVTRVSNMDCASYAQGDAGTACDLVWDCDGL